MEILASFIFQLQHDSHYIQVPCFTFSFCKDYGIASPQKRNDADLGNTVTLVSSPRSIRFQFIDINTGVLDWTNQKKVLTTIIMSSLCLLMES